MCSLFSFSHCAIVLLLEPTLTTATTNAKHWIHIQVSHTQTSVSGESRPLVENSVVWIGVCVHLVTVAWHFGIFPLFAAKLCPLFIESASYSSCEPKRKNSLMELTVFLLNTQTEILRATLNSCGVCPVCVWWVRKCSALSLQPCFFSAVLWEQMSQKDSGMFLLFFVSASCCLG